MKDGRVLLFLLHSLSVRLPGNTEFRKCSRNKEIISNLLLIKAIKIIP